VSYINKTLRTVYLALLQLYLIQFERDYGKFEARWENTDFGNLWKIIPRSARLPRFIIKGQKPMLTSEFEHSGSREFSCGISECIFARDRFAGIRIKSSRYG
jgi:thymidylate synthase ThyX